MMVSLHIPVPAWAKGLAYLAAAGLASDHCWIVLSRRRRKLRSRRAAARRHDERRIELLRLAIR